MKRLVQDGVAKGYGIEKTRKGYHAKILLSSRISFWTSIELRDYLGDDSTRMIKDVLRYRAGARMIDVLFDKKTYINETVELNAD